MEPKRGRFRECWLYPVIGLALMTASACHSGPASSGSREAAATTDSGHPGAHIDVLCIGDRINDPPESFHYSYLYTDASGSVEKQADITAQAMDITIRDKSGSHTYHGTRSDETSWDRAVLDLSSLNITAMSSRLVILNDGSAIVHQGAEPLNGYNTTKYAIDTVAARSSDRQKFETLFGKGSFEKGVVWMGPDGCAVKLSLDEGIAQTDGGVNKAHYEIARIKK